MVKQAWGKTCLKATKSVENLITLLFNEKSLKRHQPNQLARPTAAATTANQDTVKVDGLELFFCPDCSIKEMSSQWNLG